MAYPPSNSNCDHGKGHKITIHPFCEDITNSVLLLHLSGFYFYVFPNNVVIFNPISLYRPFPLIVKDPVSVEDDRDIASPAE